MYRSFTSCCCWEDYFRVWKGILERMSIYRSFEEWWSEFGGVRTPAMEDDEGLAMFLLWLDDHGSGKLVHKIFCRLRGCHRVGLGSMVS